MVTKSRLRLAIAAEKGVDFKKLKQQKKHKEALKRKGSGAYPSGVDLGGKAEDNDDEDTADEESEDDETGIVRFDIILQRDLSGLMD